MDKTKTQVWGRQGTSIRTTKKVVSGHLLSLVISHKSIELIGIVIIQNSNRANRFSLKTTTMCRWVALGSIHIIRRRGDGEGVTTSGSDIYLRKTGSTQKKAPLIRIFRLNPQCPVSPERIVLDLESEVNQGPGFYSH